MHRIGVTIQGKAFEIELPPLPPASAEAGGVVQARVRPLNGEAGAFETVELRWQPFAVGGGEWYLVNQRPYEVMVDLEQRYLRTRRVLYPLEVRDLQASYARPVSGDGRVKSPIPGVITRLFVQPGDLVLVGQPLLILEAMKMQNEIRAPRPGVVRAVFVQPGESVPLKKVLVEID